MHSIYFNELIPQTIFLDKVYLRYDQAHRFRSSNAKLADDSSVMMKYMQK